MARLRIASFTCMLALVGCGGEDEGRPSLTRTIAPPLDQCTLDDGLEFMSLVPFDLSDGFDPTRATCADGVACSFFFNYNASVSPGSEAARMCPVAEGAPPWPLPICPSGVVTQSSVGLMGVPSVSELPDPRCGQTGYAWHFTATNLANCVRPETSRRGWGGALDVTFTNLLDATGWDGLSFWARHGEGAGGDAMIVSLVDQYAAGLPACVSVDPDLECPPLSIPDTEKCDAFGSVVTLRDEWTFFEIDFADMTQKGFGKASPLGELEKNAILRMQFLITAGDWDFWIDDVSLFRRPQ